MNGYEYSNDYEQKETQKYEGTYTPEEIELNKKLLEACAEDATDFAYIEELLKHAADPLGGTALFGWDLLIHIYGDVVGNSQESNSVIIPRLTELFLKYGMDVDNPRIPYDNDNSLNPLWEFAFATNENSIIALKLLLDHGLSADSFAEFWDHSMGDFFLSPCGDPQNDEHLNYECTWTFKMLFLGASYDHIFENDEHLRKFICCENNSYDMHKFRNWNEYEYYFDTSHCKDKPELYGSIVHIFEKQSGSKVWVLGVGKAGKEVLNNLFEK